MLAAGFPQLKDRIFRSKDYTASVTGLRIYDSGLQRPKRYKAWSEDRLVLAFNAVQQQGLTVRQAAEAFDVPKSTLHDRLSGRVPFGKLSGHSRYLSGLEEAELVNFLKQSSKVGYAGSKADVLAVVQRTVNEKGKSNIRVSSGWWESFKRRHPKVTLRSAEPLAYCRAVANNPVVINRYYDYLEETLCENDLLDKPCQVFNCDETGFPLSPSTLKVVTTKGDRHPYSINSGQKCQLTV